MPQEFDLSCDGICLFILFQYIISFFLLFKTFFMKVVCLSNSSNNFTNVRGKKNFFEANVKLHWSFITSNSRHLNLKKMIFAYHAYQYQTDMTAQYNMFWWPITSHSTIGPSRPNVQTVHGGDLINVTSNLIKSEILYLSLSSSLSVDS